MHQPARGPRLAVIAGTGRLLEIAHELEVDTVLLVDHRVTPPAQAALATRVLRADLADHDDVRSALAPLHAEHPFTSVLSLSEPGSLPAAKLRAEWGIYGNSVRTVEALKDKVHMRTLLEGHGLNGVPWTVPRGPHELEAFRLRSGGKVVLKPSDGVGSNDVRLIASREDVQRAWHSLEAGGSPSALAEVYLDGPEVSVESFSYRGTHEILAVTDKLVDEHFVETGHTMPSRLPSSTVSQVRELVTTFLDTVGILEGPAHTEVKVTRAGPRVVESHERIGGDRIRVLLELSRGLDVPKMMLVGALGLGRPARSRRGDVRGAAVRVVAAEPGLVVRTFVPPLGASEDVQLDVGVGDVVRRVRRSRDRAGLVVAGGPDAESAANAAEALAARVVVATVPAE